MQQGVELQVIVAQVEVLKELLLIREELDHLLAHIIAGHTHQVAVLSDREP